MTSELNSRIGRTLPSPLFGVLVSEPRSSIHSRPRADWLRLPRPVWMAAVMLAALWPHWIYVVHRLVDRSDEPWGLLALVTVVALLWRDRDGLIQPTRSALVGSAILAILAAVAHLVLPDLAAAAVAMLALALFLIHA